MDNRIEELENEIEEIKVAISDKQDEIDNFELDPYDYEQEFCDMLDETNESCMGFQPSDILINCDPIAYRCGLIDYVDSYSDELLERNSDYNNLLEELEELKSNLIDLETELEELEEE